MSPTKILPLALVVIAGAALAWIALRAPEPDYVPPSSSGLGSPAVSTVSDGAVPAELTGEVPVGMQVRTIEVEGMCCHGCTAKLHAALVALPDVNEAAVSFEAGRAQAVVPADVDPVLLVEALNFDKYTASLVP